MNVFVYGSLRRGLHNSGLLKNQHLVTTHAWCYGLLYDTGSGYPVLILDGSNKIFGEIYDVDEKCLEKLNLLEGYDEYSMTNFYNRETINIQTNKGIKKAYVYTMEQPRGYYRLIEDGDWVVEKYLQENDGNYLYFAYGSCMDTNRMKEKGVDHLFTDVDGVGQLEGFSVRFTHRSESDNKGRADLVENEDIVEGIVYRIGIDAFEYLKRREGAPFYYRAVLVNVTINKKIEKMLTFIAVNKTNETPPPKEYVREIVRGATGRLSEPYIKKLVTHIDSLQNEIKENRGSK